MSAEIPDHTEAGTIFPLAYGNEEESGMMENSMGSMQEPYLLVGSLKTYVPKELQSTSNSALLFLRNGMKVYAGGVGESFHATNFERATQEVSQPADVPLAIHAAEQVLIKTAENFVQQQSALREKTVTLRSQRRVVDGSGSRKACHDNYGLAYNAPFVTDQWSEYKVTPDVLAYAGARSIITGAGYVRHDGLRFSQKLGGLKSVYGYGYLGTMLRFSKEEGNPRIESRDNDINISDWAIECRIAGMAGAIALSQTPLAQKLPQLSEEQTLQVAKHANKLDLQEDGTIAGNPGLIQAIDTIQASSDLILHRLGVYVEEIPEGIYWAARERYNFCDDLRKVVRGEATVALLRDRADWAAKFSLMLSRLHRDREEGQSRTLYDFTARAADMSYDYREISATNGKLHKMKIGTGYKIRALGKFKGSTPTDRQVTAAYRRPIPGTRAEIRGYLLEHYQVSRADWDCVVIANDDQDEHFYMPDVNATTLHHEDTELLAGLKKIR